MPLLYVEGQMHQDDLALEEEVHRQAVCFCSVSLAALQQRRGLFAGALREPSERTKF